MEINSNITVWDARLPCIIFCLAA